MTFCTKQGLQICRAYVTTKHLKLQCGLVNLTVFTSSAYVRNFSSYASPSTSGITGKKRFLILGSGDICVHVILTRPIDERWIQSCDSIELFQPLWAGLCHAAEPACLPDCILRLTVLYRLECSAALPRLGPGHL